MKLALLLQELIAKKALTGTTTTMPTGYGFNAIRLTCYFVKKLKNIFSKLVFRGR